MTVTTYRSTDASAPVLTGSVGTLLTVLDACLVNGYGALSAAGWTKPFSNSGNIGCYKNSATDGTGFCLNVNDAGPGAGGAREARMTGFETMSALSTGTGQFPTSGQMAIGIGAVVCRKSTTADSTARAWTIVADDTVFYLFTETGDNVTPVTAYPFMFGDFFSFKASDAYRCMIIGRNAENTASASNDGFSALMTTSPVFLTQTMIGHYMPRTFTGIGGALLFGKHIDHAKLGAFGPNGSLSGASVLGFSNGVCLGYSPSSLSSFPYPNGPDGGLYVSPIWLHHSSVVRGYLKGLWAPLHDRPLNHNDTYSGSGNMSGKSFLAQSVVAYNTGVTVNGQVHLETSSTWS